MLEVTLADWEVVVVLVRVAAVLATLSPEESVLLAGVGAIPADICYGNNSL